MQDGRPVQLSTSATISGVPIMTVTLHRAPFEIRTPVAAWAAQMSDAPLVFAFGDEPCFANLLHTGASFEDTPYFGVYRAMAVPQSGLGDLLSASDPSDHDYGWNNIYDDRFNTSGEGYCGFRVAQLLRRYHEDVDLMQGNAPVTMVFYIERGAGHPATVTDEYGKHDVVDAQEVDIVQVTFTTS